MSFGHVTQRRIRAVTSLWVALVGVVAAWMPLGFVLAYGLWPPLLNTHETFGVHFSAPWMQSHEYYFIRNAHAFTLVYTYLPNWISAQIPGLGVFDRTALYILLVYAFHATLLSIVVFVIARSPLSVLEKLAVGFVGFTPYFLTNRMIPGLTVNYQLLIALLFMILAYLYARWSAGLLRMTPGLVLGLGAVSALATGTKPTLLIMIVPYCVHLVLATPGQLGPVRRLLMLGVCSLAFGLAILVGYFLGHVEHLPRFVSDMVHLNTDPSWLKQRDPKTAHELFERFDFRLSPFGAQVGVLLAIAVTGFLGVLAVRRRDLQVIIYVLITLGCGGFCWIFLAARTAPNTVVDVGAYAAFAAAVSAVLLVRRGGIGRIALVAPGLLVAVFCAIPLLTLFLTNIPWRTFAIYQRASHQARLVDRAIERTPHLPTVYYLGPFSEHLLFPSVHIYSLYSGDAEPLLRVFFANYFPRVRFLSPVDFLREPHTMVVPEFRGERDSKYWVGVPQIRRFGGRYPDLDAAQAANVDRCETIGFRGETILYNGSTDLTWPLMGGASHVTVCEVRTVPPRVSGTIDDPEVHGPNLALERPTRQSSTAGSGVSSQAVDGRIDREGAITSLAHTHHEPEPWWEVDLGDAYDIDTIRIWNRPDTGRERLRAIHVMVSEQPFPSASLTESLALPGIRHFLIDQQIHLPSSFKVGARGRYLRIQRDNPGYLALGEVEIFGAPKAQ